MNTYKYFTPGTREEMKNQYRKLCYENHPDKGGNTRTMQEINAEWATIQAQAAYTEASDRQQTAHADGKKSAADYHDLNEVAEILRAKIEIALNLSGVDVELMGLWIWCTGNTKEHRETFKANGFRWAQNKTAWYYAGVPTFNRKKTTLDEIRNAYGSQTFKRDERASLPG
jgi:curved DNA-binding protein CbpA